MPADNPCSHPEIECEPSKWADRIGYQRSTAVQRAAALTGHGQVKRVQAPDHVSDALTFPAPLVLPEDDLAYDPTYPKQSFRSWLREKERNAVTEAQNVVYVAETPRVASNCAFIREWIVPQCAKSSQLKPDRIPTATRDYLSAFFAGLPVKKLPQPLQFVPWEASKSRNSKKPEYIGLKTSTECIGIRTRPCPDGSFTRQLNVNDLIDAVIGLLPADAYSVLLFVDHDIYEEDQDDFICGRAYGGSRAAVVSTARYHPGFDSMNNLDPYHAWPASHCKLYMERELAPFLKKPKPASSAGAAAIDLTGESPLENAIAAFRKSCESCPSPNVSELEGIWLSRVCRTASHELGHCFGMDHCVYYACNMQGTAGMVEDIRQPPYLCPVCLTKLLHATSVSAEERYTNLLAFCEKWKSIPMFAAYAAWLRSIE